MLTGRAVCVAAWLLTCCILYGEGGSVTVVFAESDASGSESNPSVMAPVRMTGHNDGPITLEVIPLTISQYSNDPETYEQSCDRLIVNIGDPAEVEDFNTTLVSQDVPSGATALTGSVELDFMIQLVNDDREEQKESLLLWLNASASDDRDSVTITANRRCIRVDITPDQDAISLNYMQLVTEVSEGDGTVEVLRIVKQGETELTKRIDFSGSSSSAFTVTPSSITLQPENTTATVSMILRDNDFPEDDLEQTVTASGATEPFRITIKDNDYVLIGFDQTEVTVTEGETVTLTTSFKNISRGDYLRSGSFEVFTSPGKGNATALDHYSNFSNLNYFPGNPIEEVTTIDDDKLEASRQFEVRLRDPTGNPLNVLSPNHVIITILDNDGTPNVPNMTRVTLNEQSKGDISVTWKIETHELRPVRRYILMYSITETKTGVSKPEQSDSGEIDSDNRMLGRQQFNVTIREAEVNCKLNATSNHCKHIVKLEGEFKTDTTHNAIVRVCAENEFGRACGDPASAILLPGPLSSPEPQQPRGLGVDVIIGVVVIIVVIVLLCCLLWTIVAVLCGLCGVGEVEKKYRPEKREKDNEEQLEKYRRMNGSESPAPVDV